MKNNLPIIRQADQLDCAAIAACARDAYHHYIERIGKPPAPMLADFSTLIAESKVHVLTLAQSVAGYVVSYPLTIAVTDNCGQTSDRKAYFLENIAVDPQQQRMGYGQLLLSHVESMARECGCTTIELYTNELMVENISWYAALGFKETERRYEDGFHRVYMTLTVAD